VIAGRVAGFTSFVSHAGGPSAAVCLLSRGLGKTGYQASTVAPFFALTYVLLTVTGTKLVMDGL